MSKYPAFERITAGKLVEGDVLLVRDRQDDRLVTGGTYPNYVRLDPGQHTVVEITSRLVPGWSKSSRYYDLMLDDDEGMRSLVTVSSSQRLNRITA